MAAKTGPQCYGKSCLPGEQCKALLNEVMLPDLVTTYNYNYPNALGVG